jgi:hypothetical protein
MIVQKSCTILQIWEAGDAKLSDKGPDEEATMDAPDRPVSRVSGHEARGTRTRREELVDRVARAIGEDGDVEALGGSGCSAVPRPPRRTTASPRPPSA